MNHRIFALILTLVVIGLVVSGCQSLSPKYQQARRLAENTVTHEDTYGFDGDPSTLKLVKVDSLSTPYTWTFTYTYNSLHAGYGDRQEQIVAQVITPHTAVVTVKQGTVTSAVLDGRWDMIQQKLIN